MPYRAMIFDFNGVLFWDTELQERSWKVFSAELRGTALSDAEIEVHLHGRTNGYTLEYLLGRSLSKHEIDAITEEKESVYRAACLTLGDAFCLSPGAVELLDFLSAQSIPHAIATASAKPNVDFFAQQFNLLRWFKPEQIVYDDGVRPGKPAPDIYLAAAAALGIAPADCVVVEDSHSGIEAAHAAGIGYIIGIGPAAAQPKLVSLPGVNQVVETLAQVDGAALFLSRE